VKVRDKAILSERKARLDVRLDPEWQEEQDRPMLRGGVQRFEMSARTNAIPCGGIGLVHEFARSIGLAESIDAHLHVFKRHFPYHESDHVLNMIYNVVAGGTCLEDIDRLRNDESYMDTLGALRIPDQTTAGDFLRRCQVEDIVALMRATHEVRRRVWKRLPKKERALALIDVDGTIAPTLGELKQGMDLSYKGEWGYAPLIVSLANTREVLYAVNRPGNQVSHANAPVYMDSAVMLVRSGGFAKVRLRGDTDFSLTEHFDRWDLDGVQFVFGIDAHALFVARAQALDSAAFRPLKRRAKWTVKTTTRARRENVKERIVRERGFTSLTTEREEVAEITYQPSKSRRSYRMVVLKKTIRVEQGQLRLEDEVRYFFYVTNVPCSELSAEAVILQANARCDQENVIEQLKNGVRAMRMPSDGLLSNWAYLVIVAQAWNLKAWMSICLPQQDKREVLRRMEFRRFVNELVLVPCQVLKTARAVVLRILAWSRWAGVIIDGHRYFREQRFG